VADVAYTPEETALVQDLVDLYRNSIPRIRGFLMSFHSHFSERTGVDGPLSEIGHSVKFRMKDPEHLRAKLFRKIDAAKRRNEELGISTDNLFLKINDLGGYRILHLHTSQAATIHAVLLEVIETAQFELFERPFANIWDEEARTFFEQIGVRTEVNPRMYSSVHYVIQPRSRHSVTCEIQVRTLADEIWGEVDHRINYPLAHPSVGCREQIKVLARVASSCSRLVDSIMAAHNEWSTLQSSEGIRGPTTDPRLPGNR